jgi:hypothetical protein
MARTKGSKNKTPEQRAAEAAAKDAAKAAKKTAPTAQAGLGHNSGTILTDQDKTVLLLDGVTDIERLSKESQSINGKIRDRRKKLAAIGYTKDEVDYAIALRNNKPSEETEKFRRRMGIAVVLNHPVGVQPDMIDVTNRVDGIDLAGRKGLTAGLEGLECKPPMDAASLEGQAWIQNWHTGNAQRTDTMKRAVEGAPPPASGQAAAEAFDEVVEDAPETAPDGAAPEGDRRPFNEVLADHNRSIQDQLKDQSRQLAGGEDPDMPAALRRTAESPAT